MFLKSISIRGFKSFADKTELTFTPGVVAIVGPNGSGKSNVSDAVLWALGEQSARHLRGSSMEDVIFAGSRDRPALGLAEVLLTLDNASGAIPIEYSELTIGRRLYRSGESEYLLGGKACRLADIHELLSQAGLGRGVYSVISQGRIDEVLSSRPEERRSLIDEAAGVAGHRRKRERALRKLDRVEQDLVRVHDIHSEVKRRLGPLRRQAEAARSGQGVRERLRTLQVHLAVEELKGLQTSWEQVTASQSGLVAEKERIAAALTEAAVAEEVAGRQVAESASELAGAERQAGAFRRAQERIDALSRQAGIHLSHLNERSSAAGDISSTGRLSELHLRLTESETRTAALSAEAEVSQAAYDGCRRSLSDARAGRLLLREEQTKLEKELERSVSRLSALEREESRSSAEAEEAELRLAAARERLDAQVNALGALDAGSDATGEDAVAESRAALATAIREHDSAEESFRSLNGSVAEARISEARAREAAAAAKAEEATLSELMAADSADLGIRGIAEHDGVFGSVADLISYPAEYERAFEAILGDKAKAIVVGSSSAVLGILDLSEGAGGRGYFQVAELFGSASDEAPVKGAIPLSTLIEGTDPKAPDLKPLLNGCYMVDDIRIALGAAAVYTDRTFVTPLGEVAGPGPLVFAGGDTGAEAGALRLRRLHREASERRTSLEALSSECARTRLAAEDMAATAAAALKTAETAVHAARQDEARLVAEADATQERLLSASARKAESEATIHSVQADLLSAQAHLEAITQERAQLLKAQDGGDSLEAVAGKLAAASEAESTAETALENAREAHDLVRSSLDRAMALSDHLRSEIDGIAAASEREVSGASARARAESELPLLLRALKDLRSAAETGLKQMTHALEGLLSRSGTIRAVHASHQETLRRLRMESAARTDELHKVELRRASMQGKVEAAVKHLTEDLEAPIDLAMRMSGLDIPSDEARAEVVRLRSLVNRMGPINPMAIEECDELEERDRFYDQQLGDLSESKKAILDGVSELDDHIKGLFSSTFESAAEHFTDIFSSLFPGSRGRLLLTDASDMLTTGIDIEVRIAGKRPQKLSLLSGGERALSALAFNFALYATRPTPFCILDEADAALDDFNISRYIELVERFRSTSQFFIVTHQKRTMNHADLIYGVSMQRSGVSAVVSQRAASLDPQNPPSPRTKLRPSMSVETSAQNATDISDDNVLQDNVEDEAQGRVEVNAE